MRIVAYRISHCQAEIRPSTTRRDWMDESSDRFAYKCLPLTIANAHGWELLCPCSFDAIWSGEQHRDAVTILNVEHRADWQPVSISGSGVLSFVSGYLFQTDAPYSLYVTGPPNSRKDAIVPLTAIVETHWLPMAFSMNWLFTRPQVAVHFERDEPFALIFPVDLSLVESTEPSMDTIDANPELLEAYTLWSTSRLLKARGDWDPLPYTRGVYSNGRKAPGPHRTKVLVRPFVDAAALRTVQAESTDTPKAHEATE
jgi:hypothetical protein